MMLVVQTEEEEDEISLSLSVFIVGSLSHFRWRPSNSQVSQLNGWWGTGVFVAAGPTFSCLFADILCQLFSSTERSALESLQFSAMAATTFGGGPTTEQRSAFASYKEGTQTPG